MATRLTMLAFCGPVLVNELDFDGLDALFRVDEGMLGRECRDFLYSRYIQVKQSYKSSSRSWFRVYKDQELHWGRAGSCIRPGGCSWARCLSNPD